MLFRLLALFRNELSKLGRSKLTWLGAGATALTSFLWPQGAIIAGASAHFTGFIFLKTVAATAFESVIPLFVVLSAASLMASEAQLGTDRTVLCGPAKRWEWLAAKYLAALGFAALLMAVHVATAVWAAWKYDFAFRGYEEFGEIIVPASATARHYALAYLWLFLPMAAAAAFGLMVSTLAGGALGAAMGAGAGLFASLMVFKPVLKIGGFDLAPWFFMSHLGASLQIAEELSAAMSQGWWRDSLRDGTLIHLGTIGVCLAVSFWMFQRRDLTG
jgi:ABC-type transport system involved in multi-copper enzyme maturation permease subunit